MPDRKARLAFLPALAAALVGCAVNSDGSITPGLRSSSAWHRQAPPQDIRAYYDRMSLAELCETWWLSHRSGSPIDGLADKHKLEAFERRGWSLADCRPGQRGPYDERGHYIFPSGRSE